MSLEPIRILLIEDEPDLRETLAELLEERDYHVETVPSSEAAVSLARDKSFDVVITDIRTEGQYDGLSALEKVKEQQPEVAGVVITGYSTEDYALRAVKLKVEDYLKKPFQLTDFIQRIEAIASQKRKSKEEAHQRERFRKTLLWFAEQIASAGSPHAHTQAEQLMESVKRLAEKLNLGQELSQELLIAGALTYAQEMMGLELPDYIQLTLPPSVLSALHHRHERWDGQGEPDGLKGDEIPLASRVLRLALELASRQDQKAGDLAAAKPGEFDPELVELFDREMEMRHVTGDARTLLAVGLALEDAGEFEKALSTFRLLAQDYPGTRSEVFGSLGEARMNRTRGDLEGAIQSARRAFSLAKRQGPTLAGECGLQTGILLSQLNHESGRKILTEAARLLNDVRDVGGKAVSVLALAHFWGLEGPVDVAARTLLSPECTPDFQASSHWLARFLVGGSSFHESLAETLLSKLAQDSPSSIIGACRDTSLPGPSRARALVALGKHVSGPLLERLAEELKSDGSPEVREAVVNLNEGEKTSHLPTLRLSCLGGFRVHRGESRLDSGWRRLKPKFFLAYLASLGNRAHSDEALVEVFWPGDADKGRASLRAALSYLRRELQPDGMDLNYFLKPPGNVQLNPELPLWFDLVEMEKAVARMRQLNSSGQREKAVATARYVAKLYEGPFLDNCYMDWAISIRERTDLGAAEALTLLTEWCEGTQRFDEAVEFGQRLLQLDPSVESVHTQLVRIYLSQEKTAEARRQYERCEKALREELDVEPSEELRRLVGLS